MSVCALFGQSGPMGTTLTMATVGESILMAESAKPVELRPSTLEAFQAYIRESEAEMGQALHGSAPFLWCDAVSDRAVQVHRGQILGQRWSGKEPVKIQDGLIHDWIGAAFAAGTTVNQALALVQDYNNHKNIYKPEVIDSKLLEHHDNNFQIYLRLLKKKIITVVLDTDHDVHYSSLDATRWLCRSYTTRIAEVEHAAKPQEKTLPPDTGYGFLWRLFSYWRFQERDGGVYIECRAISLTRDLPKGLGWIIDPIVRKLPCESLVNTLRSTCQALSSEAGRALHSQVAFKAS